MNIGSQGESQLHIRLCVLAGTPFFEGLRRSGDHAHDGLFAFYLAIDRPARIAIGTAHMCPCSKRIPLAVLPGKLRNFRIMG